MKPKIPSDLREGFSKRLMKVLDEHGWPNTGRVARVSEAFGVTPSAASAWLTDTIPSIDTVIRMCEEFQVSPTYLLTGKGEDTFGINSERLERSMRLVHKAIDEKRGKKDISLPKLALLYSLTYNQLSAGKVNSKELESQVALAAG